MVVTKPKDVTKQGFCKILSRKLCLRRVSYQYLFNVLQGGGRGCLFEFELEGEGVRWGWALIKGWALINFFCPQDGRLFEVDTNSRLGAYSNKYGSLGNATDLHYYRIPTNPDAPVQVFLLQSEKPGQRLKHSLADVCHAFAVPPNNPQSLCGHKSYQFTAGFEYGQLLFYKGLVALTDFL